MSLQEAAQLVIQAGALTRGGDVFLLDMGEPVRIADLAIKMIHLAGMSVREEANPEGDIEINFMGLRPGEKLHEELLISGKVTGTAHPRILRAQESHPSAQSMIEILAKVHYWLEQADEAALAQYLLELACQDEGLENRATPPRTGDPDYELKPWH